MTPEPLHPAVVHFPLVLAVLLPLAAGTALVLIGHGRDPRQTWGPVAVIALALTAFSWAAVQTGEQEEEAVEQIVAERVLHDHEEAAELFLPLSLGVSVLFGGGLLANRPGVVARYAATVASLILLIAAVRVGHTGGELVYGHGAANAYAANAARDVPDTGSSRDSRDHEGVPEESEGAPR